MTDRFPYGYAKDSNGVMGMGTMLTREELERMTTVRNLHPEFWRRTIALMEFAASRGVPLGVGTGWRIQPNPPPPGFASPGNSNHEGFPAGSDGAVAIDTVPAPSWPWMEQNCAAFGLRTFKNVNSEPWHIQPSDIPAARDWRREKWNLPRWDLPGQPVPPPQPEPVEDDMPMFIAKDPNNPQRYATGDGMWRREWEGAEWLDELKSTIEDRERTGICYRDLRTGKEVKDITAVQTAGKWGARLGLLANDATK